MYVYRLISSVIFLPLVFTSVCLWVGSKLLECGTFTHPNCKFKAEYITIKPEEIDIGFGDAYFDTHDVDVELSCSLRTPIKGKYTIAIVSYEEGKFEYALDRFKKWINKTDSGNGTIFSGNQRIVGKHGTMETRSTLLSINQKADTIYTCICPQMQYEKVNVTSSMAYISATKVLPTYGRSSSFYKVPVYAPCEMETCSSQMKKHLDLDYCYETKIGPHLSDCKLNKNRTQVLKLVTYCNNTGIRNNWITEKWGKDMTNEIMNFLEWSTIKDSPDLYKIGSKTVLENVCSEMSYKRKLKWIYPKYGENEPLKLSFINVRKLMHNNPNFPWFLPDEQEIGSLLFLDQYKRLHMGKLLEYEKKSERYPRCYNHMNLLEGMMAGSPKQRIHKFFTKTYPLCNNQLDPEENSQNDPETWFELKFNDNPAFFDSKHFSLPGAGKNILQLKTLPQNATYTYKTSVEITYKYTAVDCSLYSWKKSEGIQNYSREILELKNVTEESKIRRITASGNMIFHYTINDSIIEAYGEKYKMLIGCYVQYEIFCWSKSENQSCGENIKRTDKMQFYVQPQLQLQIEPLYSPKMKLIGCKSAYPSLICEKEDAGEICLCICKVALCSPLKTRHEVRKSVPCVDQASTTKTTEASDNSNKKATTPKEDDHGNTMLTVGLLVLAGFMFITGIIVTLVFHKKNNSKARKKEDVRVLTLISEDSTTAKDLQGQHGEFFHTEETTSTTGNSSDKPACSTGDGSKATTDVDGDKASVVDVSSITR